MNTTPFSQTLSYLSRGSVDSELTEELAQLVKAVRETGRAGEITLKIKVQMHSAKDEDTVVITPSVNNKLPKHDMAKAIMYSTYDGDLLRNDPNQTEMNLREIKAADTVTLKTVAKKG